MASEGAVKSIPHTAPSLKLSTGKIHSSILQHYNSQYSKNVKSPHFQLAALVQGKQSPAVTRDERIARTVWYQGVEDIKNPCPDCKNSSPAGKVKKARRGR